MPDAAGTPSYLEPHGHDALDERRRRAEAQPRARPEARAQLRVAQPSAVAALDDAAGDAGPAVDVTRRRALAVLDLWRLCQPGHKRRHDVERARLGLPQRQLGPEQRRKAKDRVGLGVGDYYRRASACGRRSAPGRSRPFLPPSLTGRCRPSSGGQPFLVLPRRRHRPQRHDATERTTSAEVRSGSQQLRGH